MEAVLRRARPTPAGVRCVGRLRVDLDGRNAYIDAEQIALTRKEFELLAVLTEQPGTTVRRERLFTEVWHTQWPGTSRTLDVHMATLRAKTLAGAQIQTVRGVGYRLVAVDAVA
jgi:DNA-binding response OmpR family regulator